MKKVTPIEGDFISRTTQSRPGAMKKGNKSNNNLGEMLKKLDGQQLVELGSKVLDTASSGMDLLKEKEKTSQVRAQISLDMKKVEAGKQAAVLDFKIRTAEFDAEDKIDQRRHAERVLELSEFGKKQNDEDGHIMKILDLVEAETISAELLAELINQIKS
ncbi:hypothetical protein [Thalassotalea sp. ND16A]|uniref:hypothetical protein n=1 Tax=Thalassotalea sp. ND16A TaxID=1535422 RepID=UPI00051A46A8|nr:hypothetical protein [Thalassotalea sp. ND16A]KGJ91609.1 hypothetical protein ND16A_1800 [Thalassotalea sp. ND16A]